MRNLCTALAAIVLLPLAAMPARADRVQELTWCNGTVASGVSLDLRIAGCTARIRSGEEDPLNVFMAFINRGDAYSDLGDYTHALADFDQATKLQPDFPVSYFNRGNAYNRMNQFARAIKEYDHVLRLNPNYVQAVYYRGNSYSALGQYARAIADFDSALTLKPDYADVFAERGKAKLKLGDIKGGNADLARARALQAKAGK